MDALPPNGGLNLQPQADMDSFFNVTNEIALRPNIIRNAPVVRKGRVNTATLMAKSTFRKSLKANKDYKPSAAR